jgi:hypothetical protein
MVPQQSSDWLGLIFCLYMGSLEISRNLLQIEFLVDPDPNRFLGSQD